MRSFDIRIGMVSLGARNALVVLAALLFGTYQMSKTWSRSAQRKHSLESEFQKALNIIEKNLDPDMYDIYRASKERGRPEDIEDVFRSTVIIVRRGRERGQGEIPVHILPTVVAEISRDRRRLTTKEKRKIAKTVKGKSRRQRKEAVKSKQFLKLDIFDPSLDYLLEPLQKAGIVRATQLPGVADDEDAGNRETHGEF